MLGGAVAVQGVAAGAEGGVNITGALNAVQMANQSGGGDDSSSSSDAQEAVVAPLRPEAKYVGSKKHGIKWTEGSQLAVDSRVAQGQWGSKAYLDYVGAKAATLAPRQSGGGFAPES